MKARRLFIAAMWINLLGASATAETSVIRPDPCPLPADAPKIIAIEADDLNPQRAAGSGRVIVLYPVAEHGWASARILSRFDLEGAPRRSARACRG